MCIFIYTHTDGCLIPVGANVGTGLLPTILTANEKPVFVVVGSD
jgi:hypothetical protein